MSLNIKLWSNYLLADLIFKKLKTNWYAFNEDKNLLANKFN